MVRRFGEPSHDAAESETLRMCGNSRRENREIPFVSKFNLERSANVPDGTADMNADGKSDDFVVLTTWANKAVTAVAESV